LDFRIEISEPSPQIILETFPYPRRDQGTPVRLVKDRRKHGNQTAFLSVTSKQGAFGRGAYFSVSNELLARRLGQVSAADALGVLVDCIVELRLTEGWCDQETKRKCDAPHSLALYVIGRAQTTVLELHCIASSARGRDRPGGTSMPKIPSSKIQTVTVANTFSGQSAPVKH
jgi:hypothetical protein